MRKLPVTEAFSHSFRSTTNNLAFAFHVSWPWMVVLLPVLIAGNIYMLANMTFAPGDFPAGVIAFSFLMAVLQALAFASIAVNWHRYVLLDEMPQGAQRLRIDGTVWRYFGNILLISLIIGLCIGVVAVVVFLLAAMIGEASLIIAIPIYLVAALVALAGFYRLGVKLPGVALERRDFGLSDAWRVTDGNTWQMVGLGLLYLLVGIGAALLIAAISAVLGFIPGSLGVAISVAVQLVFQWVLTILGITLLTSLYGYFVENRNF